MSNGLGEGWADFHAVLLTVKQTDSLLASNTTFNGIYPLSNYSGFNNYFGWHGGNNVEVHRTGEIWATMLWESYASLLRDTLGASPRLTFDQAQGRMKDYIVAAYKMTPLNPTLIEARDALLAAVYATDTTDYTEFWQAFARRGAGINVVAPDRYSETNTPGLVESYDLGGTLAITSTSLVDTIASCNRDGYLDKGETGQIFVTVKNTGSVALNSTTASVTTTNPNMKFPFGNLIDFPSIPPAGSATASVILSLNGVAGIQQIDFTISASDPALNPAGSVVAATSVWANANFTLNASASDNVESPASPWTPVVANGFEQFTRTVSSTTTLNYVWHGFDIGNAPYDHSLVSPPLAVGGEDFSFTFSHRFSFGGDEEATIWYDGGVIELTTDNGATWTDIGSGYNHTIWVCPLIYCPAGTPVNPLSG
jgi:large repetitive protein